MSHPPSPLVKRGTNYVLDYRNIYLFRTVIESSERKHFIERIISYPSYDKTTINQDIALVKIKPPIFFGRYVQPACLPVGNIEQSGEGYLTGDPFHFYFINSEAVVRRYYSKLVFLKMSQTSRENTCVGVSF